MQFELLKAQVAKATATAKAFKGFDEMAEKDEYLKTDSLNVVNRRNFNKTNLNDTRSKNSVNNQISSTKGSPSNLPGKVLKKKNSSPPTHGNRKSTLESFSTDTTDSKSSSQSKTTTNRKLPSSKKKTVAKKSSTQTLETNDEEKNHHTDLKINLPDNLFANEENEWSILDKVLPINSSNSKKMIHSAQHEEEIQINDDIMKKKKEDEINKRPEKVIASDYSIFSRMEALMQNAEKMSETNPLDEEEHEEEIDLSLSFGNHFDDSDEENDDIVLQMMKRGHNKKRDTSHKQFNSHVKNNDRKEPKTTTITPSIPTLNDENIMEDSISEKDPNRFFTDLEDRLSTNPKHNPSQQQFDDFTSNGDHVRLSVIGSFAAADKLAWLQKVTAPGISFVTKNLSSKQDSEMDKLNRTSNADESRYNLREDQKYVNDYDEEEFGILMTSSDLLGTEEKAELERLNRSAHTSVLDLFCQMLVQNRNFVFLSFTFILMIVVYFYTRKRLINDVR